MSSSGRTDYVPLWCRSNYSFLEGASDPGELIEQARRYDLPAVGIADRDGLYGSVRALGAWREGGRGRARPLVGAQITVARLGSLLLYARDRNGYGNLCELISAGRLRNPKGQCSVETAELLERADGLTLVIVPEPDYPPVAAVESLREAFAGRIYLGIARHAHASDVVLERRGRSLAGRLEIPLVATPLVLYHTPERRALHDIVTCIRHGCSLEEAGSRLQSNAEHTLKTRSAMRSRYADCPALLDRTMEIAETLQFTLEELEYRYPDERLPDGYTSSGRLRELVYDGAGKRYPDGIPADVSRQLERELSVIDDLDYCGYFLTMYEIVTFCRREGILCQGRGSAANSAVCFCLGITAVDPVRMNLLFERFLSRERAEPPDIDLDIEHDRREEVIEFMYRRYGRRHAAMVANVVRYRPRSAVREVGKVLGFPETTLDRIARLAPHRDSTVADAVRAAGLDPDSGSAAILVRQVEEIIGAPRHLSIHPGGFLLGGEPVTRLVPVENATMPGRTVIQWDKDDIEELDLFKVDLLGLGALTHLDYCFRLLERHRGIHMSMADIPPDSPGVFAMISRGDTVGIFQLESRAQMAMLPRMQPRNYYDIVIEISIVRPGPITGGMVHPYLRRRHGEDPVEYPHPALKPVLEKTLGVPLFQEQVMKLAVVAADYTPGEADQLRRDMAAWRKTGRMEKHHDALVERMTAKGIGKQFAERVFDQIRGFGEYGFPESHAASFALIAYATAWMRYHYRVEFTCALLNAWPMGFYAPSTIVEDARRHGIEIREADIYKSEWLCTLEEIETAGHADKKERRFAVRMGLRFTRKMGYADYEAIVRRRRIRFESVEDLLQRTGIDEDVAASLAEAGALREFGVSRRSALWRMYGHRKRREKGLRHDGKRRGGDRTQRPGGERFGDDRPGGECVGSGQSGGERHNAPAHNSADAQRQPPLLAGSEPSPELARLSVSEQIVWDYESVGYSTRGHPLEQLRDELARAGLPDAAGLARRVDGVSVRYAGLVICRQRPETAGGTLFMTLEDESGFVNLILRPDVLSAYRPLALARDFLGVSGTLQRHPTSPYILVDTLWEPDSSMTPTPVESRNFH